MKAKTKKKNSPPDPKEDQSILRSFGSDLVRVDEEGRRATFVISTDTRDRHGTVIRLDAWRLENYERNGIVAYMHETSPSYWNETPPDPDYIIGKGRVWIDNNRLMGEVEFEPAEGNPLAEKIFRKVVFGSLKATSVGFRAHKGHWGLADDGEDTGTFYFDDVELLEWSIVNIPSNPEAVIEKTVRFINSRKANATEAGLVKIIPIGLAKARLLNNKNKAI